MIAVPIISFSFHLLLDGDFHTRVNSMYVNHFVETQLSPVINQESGSLIGVLLDIENKSKVHDIIIELPDDFQFFYTIGLCRKQEFPLESDKELQYPTICAGMLTVPYPTPPFEQYQLIPKSTTFQAIIPLIQLIDGFVESRSRTVGRNFYQSADNLIESIRNKKVMVDARFSSSFRLSVGLRKGDSKSVHYSYNLPKEQLVLKKVNIGPNSLNIKDVRSTEIKSDILENYELGRDPSSIKTSFLSTHENSSSGNISSDVEDFVRSYLVPIMDSESNSLIGIALRVDNNSKDHDVFLKLPRKQFLFSFSINPSYSQESLLKAESKLKEDTDNHHADCILPKSSRLELTFPLIDLLETGGVGLSSRYTVEPYPVSLIDFTKRNTVFIDLQIRIPFYSIYAGLYEEKYSDIKLYSLQESNALKVDRAKITRMSTRMSSDNFKKIQSGSIRLDADRIKKKRISRDGRIRHPYDW